MLNNCKLRIDGVAYSIIILASGTLDYKLSRLVSAYTQRVFDVQDAGAEFCREAGSREMRLQVGEFWIVDENRLVRRHVGAGQQLEENFVRLHDGVEAHRIGSVFFVDIERRARGWRQQRGVGGGGCWRRCCYGRHRRRRRRRRRCVCRRCAAWRRLHNDVVVFEHLNVAAAAAATAAAGGVDNFGRLERRARALFANSRVDPTEFGVANLQNRKCPVTNSNCRLFACVPLEM